MLFERKIVFPFSRWIGDWDKLLVYIDQKQLVHANAVDILQNISTAQILEMQRNIQKFKRVLQYSLQPAWRNLRWGSLHDLHDSDDALTAMLKDALLHGSEFFPRLLPHAP